MQNGNMTIIFIKLCRELRVYYTVLYVSLVISVTLDGVLSVLGMHYASVMVLLLGFVPCYA